MSKEKWYDSDDPSRIVRGGTIFGLGYVTFLIVVVSILGVAGSVIALEWDSWFSAHKGERQANIIKNSAENRIQAQAQFQADFESVHSFDQRLTDAQSQLDTFNKQHPNVGNGTVYDPLAEQQANLQRTVTGLQQQCRNVVARYNANAKTYTLREFRDTDLPKSFEATDPLFASGQANFEDYNCEPNAA